VANQRQVALDLLQGGYPAIEPCDDPAQARRVVGPGKAREAEGERRSGTRRRLPRRRTAVGAQGDGGSLLRLRQRGSGAEWAAELGQRSLFGGRGDDAGEPPQSVGRDVEPGFRAEIVESFEGVGGGDEGKVAQRSLARQPEAQLAQNRGEPGPGLEEEAPHRV